MTVLSSAAEFALTVLQRIHHLRAARGPYRFLVRDWKGISDINTLATVLQTDYFRNELRPLPLPASQFRRILVLAPHADDEIIGVGGTLALAAKEGANIHICYVTDSALNGITDSVSVRRAEAESVCVQLGATMHELRVSNITCKVELAHVEHLSDLLNTIRPEVILLPWLFDFPPKHRVVTHLFWLAQQKKLADAEIWGYQVHNVLFPNGYVDITEHMDTKIALLRAYRSQISRLYRYDHQAKGMAAWNSRYLRENAKGDGVARYLEVFFTLPAEAFHTLVEQHYFTDLAATYRGHTSIIGTMRRIHKSVTGAII